MYEIKIRTEGGKVEKLYVDAKKGGGEAKKGISLDQATAIALEDTPGEVIGVAVDGNRYRVKVKPEKGSGTVKIYVDAVSGKIVKKKKRVYIYNWEYDSWSE